MVLNVCKMVDFFKCWYRERIITAPNSQLPGQPEPTWYKIFFQCPHSSNFLNMRLLCLLSVLVVNWWWIVSTNLSHILYPLLMAMYLNPIHITRLPGLLTNPIAFLFQSVTNNQENLWAALPGCSAALQAVHVGTTMEFFLRRIFVDLCSI